MNEQAPPIQQAPIQQAPKKSGGGCGKIAIGCGIATVVLLIILAIVVWFVARNAKGWIASGFASVVNQAVEQSTLPDEQKLAITSRVDRIKDEFAAGNITLEQIAQAMEKLDVEGLVAAGFAQYVGSGLIQSSQLSEAEKTAGHQALNRVAHGVLAGQIDMNEVEQVLAPIRKDPTSENWELKPDATAEDFKQVMDNANALADDAGVPAKVQEVDFAQRVNEAFDEALGIH